MSTFSKIAWRNVARNQNRSAITIAAVAAGLASLIFLKSFVDGADHQMVANYTDLLIGHIQIHKAGFQKNMSLEKNIPATDGVLASLKRVPGVKAVSGRIKDFCLISSPESSAGILLYGVDPLTEPKVSTIHQRLRAGRFFTKDDRDKIIIGKSLSEQLKAGLNDKVVLMSQASDGSLSAAAYEVSGIIETGAEEIDKNLAFIPLRSAQDLLVMEGKISEIIVKAASLESIDLIKARVRKQIDLNKFEVLDWKEISPMTYQWLQFDQVFTGFILFIVLLVVAAGILNTVLMGVLERVREFGIMLALGTKPGQITRMVTIESLILGLIGVLCGACLGIGLVLAFGITGIDLSGLSKALNSFYIGSVVYPRLDLPAVCFYAGIVLFICVIVAVFPARKASRLSPIEAIRHT